MKIEINQLKQLLDQPSGTSEVPCPPLPGVDDNTKRPAAVLMPLINDGGIWKLIFIKRTTKETDSHSGQIAFPGGRVDPEDPSYAYAALREAEEELGIQPEDVEMIGKTCPTITVTDYEIHPFLGQVPWPYPLALSRDEVVKTILIPLDWLGDDNNYQTRFWESRSRPGRVYPVIFFNEYEGEILWGATAQIVSDFLKLLQTPD